MSAITESISRRLQGSTGRGFNPQYFLQDNITGSWLLALWVAILSLVTLWFTIKQLTTHPTATTIILVVWLLAIGVAALDGLHIWTTKVGTTLRVNLLSSISNSLLTLLLLLAIYAMAYNFWQWAYVNATFNPDETAPEYRNPDGATWGVIIAAWDLLMVGRFPREEFGRVWAAFAYVFGLGVISFIVNKTKTKIEERSKRLSQIVSWLISAGWLISPIVVYAFLAGVNGEGSFVDIQTLIMGTVVVLAIYGLFWWQRVFKFSWPSFVVWALAWPVFYVVWRSIGQSGALPPINVNLWGGLLLTLIIATSVIVLSFPLGMILALGRRSTVRGIPGWLIWPVSIIAAIYYFATSTPDIWATAQNTVQQILAFWPMLILVAAYILQKMFQGNVIAAASTTFIEFIRGVPLITLLFMGIIMAPFFLSEGATLENIWAVIIAYALFSAAYMAELIRGGLQAIPRGQFDAADAIGLNTLQKMRFIILPQALRIIIPGIVGQFIGSYKSSSLVSIVGLFELLGITRAIVANPQWQGLRQELYVFVGVIYFLGSFIMSWYSRRLESRLNVEQK